MKIQKKGAKKNFSCREKRQSRAHKKGGTKERGKKIGKKKGEYKNKPVIDEDGSRPMPRFQSVKPF